MLLTRLPTPMRESGFVRLVFALVLLNAAVPTGVAAGPQNDLGTGSDAPGEAGSATDVIAGGSGLLAPEDGDFQDWYRLSAMANKGLHVQLKSSTGGVNLQIQNDDLTWMWDGDCCFGPEGGKPCCEGPGTFREAYIGQVGGAYRIGVSVCCQGGPYELVLEFVDLHDLLIDDVRVVKRHVTTDVGDLPVSTQRTIEVDVTNNGPGLSYWAGVGVWAQHETSGGRDVGGTGLPLLAPGESTTVYIPWDTTGQVGDVRLEVDLGGPLENAPENNHRSVSTFVIVGNAGFGADLFAHGVSRCNNEGCTNANTAYGQGGKGLWFNDNRNDGSENTWGHVGAHPGNAHVFLSHHNPYYNVFADVGNGGNQQFSVCPNDGGECVQ